MAIAAGGSIEGRVSQAMTTVDMNMTTTTAINAVVNRNRAQRIDIIVRNTADFCVGYKSRRSVTALRV